MGFYGTAATLQDGKIVMTEGKNPKYKKMVEEENVFDFTVWMLKQKLGIKD